MKKQETEDLMDWENISSGHIHNFKETAETMFAPVYNVLARQVVEDYKITGGSCVDIGAGTGGLACEIAKISNLTVYALDINHEMVEIINEKIQKEGLKRRVIPTIGDVHELPFGSNFADLIVSRGSFLFWKDKRKAFLEIHRVLKTGGVGFIGGGFGRDKEIREKAMMWSEETFKKANRGVSFHEHLKNKHDELTEILKDMGGFNIIHDESGLWVEIRK